MSAGLELRVLGVVELCGAARQDLDAVLAQPKRLALLAYLALNADRGFTRRDTIVGAFWPELDDAHARNALSQALRFLRRHLDDAVIVRRGEEEIALNPDIIRCDVELFEQACARGDHLHALQLYRGELLTGLFVSDTPAFDLWLEQRRAELARRYWRSLEGAAEGYERAGDAASAVECWRQRAAAEPHNSPVAKKLMLALAAAGDRAGAIEYAATHARRLAADLDASPDASIAALAERLRTETTPVNSGVAGRVERVLTTPNVSTGPATTPPRPVPATPNAWAGQPGASSTRRVWKAFLAVAAVVAVGGVVARYVAQPGGSQPSKRVVVAVFENQTGDSSLAPLGGLVSDWIAEGLQRTGLVEVVPSGTILPLGRAKVRAAGDELESFRQLARVTHADFIVSGTIRLQGEALRLQPQIIETAPLRLVGAPAPGVASRADPMPGIETVREHVMGSLASVLDSRIASWAAAASNPPSLAAFSAFQTGLDALISRHDASASITHFERAADIDSTYIVPRLWMIQALMRVKSVSGPNIDSVIASVERSRDRLAPVDAMLLDRIEAMQRGDLGAASRASLELSKLAPSSYFVQMLAEDAAFANRPHEAVEILSRLDPNLPWVREWQEYWTLFAYALHATGDFQRELAVSRRARATRPDSRRFLWLECQALAGLGRVDEVRALAATIDTLQLREVRNFAGDFKPDGFFRNVGLELRAHGNADAAREMLERADAWYAARAKVVPPSVADVHHHMLMLAELSRWPEAAAAAQVVLDSIPKDPMPTAMLGIAAASLGDSARARRQLAILAQRRDENDTPVSLYEAAKVAAALGEREQAVGLVTAAFAAGRRHTFWDHLAVEFEPLRSRPEYQQVMVTQR